jgi:hypothetical protein
MQVSQAKIASDTSRLQGQIQNNICAHFNKIYIWAYTIAICRFWISIVKDKENWLYLKK